MSEVMSSARPFASGGPRAPRGTLTQLFFDAIARFNHGDAMRFKARGKWQKISHTEIESRVRDAAFGLAALRIRRSDRVAILSENRPEWAIADYACLTARLTVVPIYPTLPAEQLPHILNDSGCVAIFVSTGAQAAKVHEIRHRIPAVHTVISFDRAQYGADLTFEELLERGRADETDERNAEWKREALGAQPDDLATLIYTSGTTGLPKGVMLTHDNIVSNVGASRSKIPFTGSDLELSFLPLSHVFQRMFDYLAFATGTTIAYAESVDAIASNMMEVQPTIMCAVPRVYEKIHARVLESALHGGWLKRRIFLWARAVGDRHADVLLAQQAPGRWLAWQYRLADRIVFSKLRARTGGRMRYFVSGSAPLAATINKFFFSAGLTILEGYGLTETSPVVTVNTPEHFRIGSVGRPVDGVDVQIAEDGEILVRGPNVMKGYYNDPTATSEVMDEGRWFHTGDIGTLEDGFLRITDRKKDLIKTSGGKYVAPQPIENRVRMNAFVNEAVLIGESRKFPAMLIVPDFERLEQWARAQRLVWKDRAELIGLSAVKEKMNAEVRSSFAGLASFETPKRIALLDQEFSIERGELTPSLKVKRKVIDRNYRAVIESLYSDNGN
jgi:long-chain acyl-CoA synthetase